MKLFIPYTKINLKCIKDLKIRPKTTKLPREITYGKFLEIGLDDDFFNLILSLIFP